MPLHDIPVGTAIHNVEMKPGEEVLKLQGQQVHRSNYWIRW